MYYTIVMSARLLDIYTPNDYSESICDEISKIPNHGIWTDELNEEMSCVKIIIDRGNTEEVSRIVEKYTSKSAQVKMVMLPVEALQPNPRHVRRWS